MNSAVINETRQDMTFLNQSTVLFSNNNSPEVVKKAVSRNKVIEYQDTTEKEIELKEETKDVFDEAGTYQIQDFFNKEQSEIHLFSNLNAEQEQGGSRTPSSGVDENSVQLGDKYLTNQRIDIDDPYGYIDQKM